METLSSPRIKDKNPKNEKFHLFSKLHIRNESTTMDISEKANFMQKSVREILDDMKNFMNNSKGKEKEQEKMRQIKGRGHRKKGLKVNNPNFNSVMNKKIMQSMNKTLSGENTFNNLLLQKNLETDFMNGIGESNRAGESNFSSNKSLVQIHLNQKNESASPKTKLSVKSSPKKREISFKDKQKEKVMKRIGTSDNGFMSSLLMNTDKNFDIFKFMDVNMYSIMGGTKKTTHDEREERIKKARDISLLANLAKINEHIQKEESEDEEFSINSAIDDVNERIESNKAILKLLMEKQARSEKKITTEINQSLTNNFSDIEKRFSQNGKIEKLKEIESLDNFQLNSRLESTERLDKSGKLEINKTNKKNKLSNFSQSEKFHKFNKFFKLDKSDKRDKSSENEENKNINRKLIFDKSLSSRFSCDTNKDRVKNLKSDFSQNNLAKTHYSTLTIKNNNLANLNFEGRVLKLPKPPKKEKKLIFSIESISQNTSLNEKKKTIFSDHIGRHLVEHSPSQGPTQNTSTIIPTNINTPHLAPLMTYANSPEHMFNTMTQFSPQSSYQNYLMHQSLPNARTVTENKKNYDSLNKMFRSQMFQSFDSVKSNLEDLKSSMKSDIKATKKQINKKIKKNNVVIKKPGEFESLGKIYKLEEETLFKKKGRKVIYNLKSHPQQIMQDLMKDSEKVNSVNINSSFKFKDIILKNNKKASNHFVNKSKISDDRKELDLRKISKNNIKLQKINMAMLTIKKG
jgi:hypothetical protein